MGSEGVVGPSMADSAAGWLLRAPKIWTARLAGYAPAVETIGCSGAVVLRLEASARPSLFLKAELACPFAELTAESERLGWFGAAGAPVPKVVAHAEESGRLWLLTTALPGRNLAASPDLAPEAIVALCAGALSDLHRKAHRSCPFDHRLEQRLTLAHARIDAGVVDESDFDAQNGGRTACELFGELLAMRPSDEDVVLTHGDACLPNLIANEGRFTGFVDLARAGLADRHQDLALAARSIESNLGPAFAGAFLKAYGGSVDRQRLAFYRLLDEFF